MSKNPITIKHKRKLDLTTLAPSMCISSRLIRLRGPGRGPIFGGVPSDCSYARANMGESEILPCLYWLILVDGLSGHLRAASESRVVKRISVQQPIRC
jgi:hypothetical protein